jgi:YggT family protein
LQPNLEFAKMIRALFWLLDELLSLYIWAVILAAIFSMLASFGVLDTRNRVVWTIGDFLYRVTEPALRPIRNILPSFGNIDLSPLILLLLLQAARMLLSSLYESVILGSLRPLL